VVVFSLVKKEDVEKEEAKQAKQGATENDTREGRHEGEKSFQPRAEDLD